MLIKRILLIALLIVITVVCFYPALEGGFVNWDDGGNVVVNHRIKHLNWKMVGNLFFEVRPGHYHNPLVFLTYAIEYHFFGLNPFIYHLNNIILHTLNVLLVLWLIQLMSRRWSIAFLVALLFAIHPLRVESVAWITERKDVLFAFFFLAGLISYIYHSRIAERKSSMSFLKRQGGLLLSITMFSLSCLSKPTAFVFPLVVILIDIYIKRRFDQQSQLEKMLFFIVAFFFTVISFGGLRSALVIVNVMPEYSLMEGWQLVFHALNFSLFKSFVPTNLSIIYPFPERVDGAFSFLVSWSPIVFVLILVGLWKLCDNKRIVLFGMGSYILFMSLPLYNMWSGFFINDRYSYMPSVGLFFIIVSIIYSGLDRWQASRNFRAFLLICFVGYIGFYATNTRAYSKIWTNDELLYSNVIKHYPAYSKAYTNRGQYYLTKGEYDQATKDFEKALEMNSNDPHALFNLGVIRAHHGELADALPFYTKVIEMKPNFSPPYVNRAIIYMEQGEEMKAMLDYSRAVQLNPTDFLAYYNRSLIFRKQGDYKRAIRDLTHVINLDPGVFRAYYLRGELHILTSNWKAAQEDLTNFLNKKPDDSRAHLLMGASFFGQKEYDHALNYINASLRFNPGYSRAYFLRAEVNKALGNMELAMKDSQLASRLGLSAADDQLDILEESLK